MTEQYVYYASNGEIQTITPELLQHKAHLVTTLTAQELLNYYVENGELLNKGTRPSNNYHFDYDVKCWVFDQKDADIDAKLKRAGLLASSDWTQLPDVPLATKEAWATYRQALRDITAQPGYPLDIVWPEPPA